MSLIKRDPRRISIKQVLCALALENNYIQTDKQLDSSCFDDDDDDDDDDDLIHHILTII